MSAPIRRPILFTPGPLTTSVTVKEAMMTDYGSRDGRFMEAIKFVREEIINIANVDPKEWACVLQQGAGTMGIEAAISTLCPRNAGKYLLINSGKYSERQGEIVQRLGIPMLEIRSGEGEEISFPGLEEVLRKNPDIAAVGYVHHETSTGMVYPAERIFAAVRKINPTAIIIVDCMSSFAGIHLEVSKACDVFVAASNKCLHGVPGVSIIVARRKLIESCKGNSRSGTLDLARQLAAFDKNGQFIITPPVQVVMALQQAIIEFKDAGGLDARVKSYQAKFELMKNALKSMGFTLFIDENRPSCGRIVVCVNMPTDPKWNFKKFYMYLNNNGFIIYPGKASHASTFRFGVIGHTSVADAEALMECSKKALKSMGIDRLGAGSNL